MPPKKWVIFLGTERESDLLHTMSYITLPIAKAYRTFILAHSSLAFDDFLFNSLNAQRHYYFESFVLNLFRTQLTDWRLSLFITFEHTLFCNWIIFKIIFYNILDKFLVLDLFDEHFPLLCARAIYAVCIVFVHSVCNVVLYVCCVWNVCMIIWRVSLKDTQELIELLYGAFSLTIKFKLSNWKIKLN